LGVASLEPLNWEWVWQEEQQYIMAFLLGRSFARGKGSTKRWCEAQEMLEEKCRDLVDGKWGVCNTPPQSLSWLSYARMRGRDQMQLQQR